MQSIREGRTGTEMQPFKSVFSDDDVKGLIAYIRAQAVLATNSASRAQSPAGQILKAEQHAFKFEVVAEGISTPWALAFMPDGRLLITERSGALRVVEKGKLLPNPIEGTPAVWTQQDGGLFDIELHPDFAKNGWIYLSYADPGPDGSSMTVIIRGRIKAGRWVDQEVLYKAPPELYWAGNIHYGSRFIFDKEGHLFYSIGDRGHEADAQDLSKPNGKIHRVNDDGSIPKDNPFVNRAGYRSEIFTLGHRNTLALIVHPETGDVWNSENGPNGGDEINIILPGRNYGWPLVSFGRDYPGPRISEHPTRDGLESPLVVWIPSIATSGMAVYTGDRFARWKGNVFVGSMRTGEIPGTGHLERIVFNAKTEELRRESMIAELRQRIREVRQGPDGLLYLLTDEDDGALLRIEPVS
jgi:glucose/arabinose dehydrogenase